MRKIILLLIFIFLLSVGVYGAYAWKRSDLEKNMVKIRVMTFDQALVQKIVLKRGSQSLQLHKSDDAWFIEENVADREKVNALLDKLVSSNYVDQVTKTEQRWVTLGLDQNTGVNVQLFNVEGIAIEEIWLGKISPDYRHQYVRTPNREGAWTVDQNMTALVDMSPEFWKAKEAPAVGQESDNTTESR
ncbi:MAG: hypothetical protein HY453_00090 [Parcubacteria group bacterium]|nr:hypothetical protein [Parcubacteria group bacterium]